MKLRPKEVKRVAPRKAKHMERVHERRLSKRELRELCDSEAWRPGTKE